MFRDFTLHFQLLNRSVLKARVRVYQPLAFKQLKGLKSACAQYGQWPPFTQAMPESGPQRSSLLGTENNWQGHACQEEIFYYGNQNLLSSVKTLWRSIKHTLS